jgi:signal peptidase I
MLRERLQRKETLNEEYEKVRSNHLINGIVQGAVTLIDLLIMFLIIWHVFVYFIPKGSWINVVDGNSMEPTMHNNQIIFADMSSVKRGDIITSYLPDSVVSAQPERKGMLLIKRVVGMPGETVEITRDGIRIDGQLLEEDYIPAESKSFTYKDRGYTNVKLGINEYYIVGDNREVSYDSRSFGPVTIDNILYKQSETPTPNFFLKAALIVAVLVFDIFLYMLIEFVLTETAYAVVYKKKQKNVNKNNN